MALDKNDINILAAAFRQAMDNSGNVGSEKGSRKNIYYNEDPSEFEERKRKEEEIERNYEKRRLEALSKYAKKFGIFNQERLDYEEKMLDYQEKFDKKTREISDLEKKVAEQKKKIEKELDNEKKKELEKEKKSLEVHKELLELETKRLGIEQRQASLKFTKDSLKQVGTSLKEITGSVQKILEPWSKIDSAASKFANSIGMSAKGMAALRKNTIDAVVSKSIAAQFNMGADELIAAQENFVKKLGRNVRQNANGLETYAAISKVMGVDSASEMASSLENFGVGMEEAGKRAYQMFDGASKKGIVVEKVTKNFLDNISLAQKYTFKDGLKGLQSMAMKAAEVNFNMQSAAGFADNLVNNGIEGAVETAAKLQVLGGPFATFADPLAMLNEGMNDMEGLQDRMMKMFGSFGTLDKATGEVRVSSFNKLRIRQASQAMGMSYDDAMKYITTNARREEIEKQLNGKSGLSKDFEELIKNTGSFENGKAGISTKDGFKTLDQLQGNMALQEEIVNEAKSEGEDIKDIAKNLRSIAEVYQGGKKQIDAKQAQITEGLGNGVKGVVGRLTELRWLIGSIATVVVGKGAIGAFKGISGAVRGARNAGTGLKGVLSGMFGGTATMSPFGNEIGGLHQLPNGLFVKKGVQGFVKDSNGNLLKAAKAAKAAGKAGKIAKGVGTAASIGSMGSAIGGTAAAGGGGAALVGGLAAVPVAGWIALAAAAVGAGIYGGIKKYQKDRKEFSENVGLGDLNGSKVKKRQGGYSMEEMRMINEAKITGRIRGSKAGQMDNLLTKIARNGDEELYNTIIAKRDSISPRKHFNEEGIKVKDKENIGPEEVKPIKVEPIEVKLSGSFRIDGLDGMDTEIKKALLKDPTFIRNITKLITEQMGVNMRGGNTVGQGFASTINK